MPSNDNDTGDVADLESFVVTCTKCQEDSTIDVDERLIVVFLSRKPGVEGSLLSTIERHCVRKVGTRIHCSSAGI